MEQKSMFSIDLTNRGLINPFSHKQASPQQRNDLLLFRPIGEKDFLQRISYFILKLSSVRAPNRKHSLQIFSEKTNKRRVSQLERDK